MSSMELRQLRYFVTLAEEMHFNRAASRLHIAQPALSQQIQRLERELKAQLFVRTTRSVELTDVGRVLLVEARRLIADAEHALSAVEHASEGRTGLLRVGFVSSAALHTVPRLVLGLHDQWPGVRLQLQESTTEVQIAAVLEGRLDVGIVREVASHEGVFVQNLGHEPLVLAVPENHALADRASAALAELAGESFVVFPRGQVSRLYDHIAALCHHAGVRFEVAQEAVQFPTILGLVAARTGIAIVPEALRSLQIPGLRYLTLTDQEAVSTVSMICSEERRRSALVANCLDSAKRLNLVGV